MTSCSESRIEKIIAILSRAGQRVVLPSEQIAGELLTLISAAGRETEGTKYEAEFRERIALWPSHAELARCYERLASSDDPLDPKYLSRIMMTELTLAARPKWSDRIRRGEIKRPRLLRGMSRSDFSVEELDDIREMAKELALYHESCVRKGQPQKHQQDTLLIGLADLYCEFAEPDLDPYELPHSRYSRFISFAYAALQPFFAKTEVSRTALSLRWKRLKDAYITAPETTRFRRCD